MNFFMGIGVFVVILVIMMIPQFVVLFTSEGQHCADFFIGFSVSFFLSLFIMIFIMIFITDFYEKPENYGYQKIQIEED